MPKQFLRMTGDDTLIQQAANRCLPAIPSERIWVVTGAAHSDETTRQLPDVPKTHVLVEPCGRNTAPCIGLAAIQLLAADPDAIMLVMPADHVIQPNERFQQAVNQAVHLIEQDPETLVLFGIEPNYPATGFGYIQRGERIPTESCPAFKVKSFQEKPNLLNASRFMASGEYYWNCGIFVWKASTILNLLRQLTPEIYQGLERLQNAITNNRWNATLEVEFPKMPSISIDYAVLEKAESRVCVLEAPFEWDDVGSWHALPRLISSDREGNTLDGTCCAVDTEGCIVRTNDQHLIATIGVKDLIIVHTPTATLVADKRDENSLKKLIAELETRGMMEYL